jgi:hypothetical protein
MSEATIHIKLSELSSAIRIVCDNCHSIQEVHLDKGRVTQRDICPYCEHPFLLANAHSSVGFGRLATALRGAEEIKGCAIEFVVHRETSATVGCNVAAS